VESHGRVDGLYTLRSSHDRCRCILNFFIPSNKSLVEFSWTHFPVNHNKWPSKRRHRQDTIQYKTKCDFSKKKPYAYYQIHFIIMITFGVFSQSGLHSGLAYGYFVWIRPAQYFCGDSAKLAIQPEAFFCQVLILECPGEGMLTVIHCVCAYVCVCVCVCFHRLLFSIDAGSGVNQKRNETENL